VVFRDLMIVGGALLFYTLTQTLKMQPLLISKANTVAQILLAGTVLGIAAMDLAEGELPMLQIYMSWFLIYLAAATTFASGVGYLVKWGRKAATMEDVH
ncbi:MAG: CDP-alcohol phosphatidyltransferase family protein, partial [Alphaproteobacteria bacterium]